MADRIPFVPYRIRIKPDPDRLGRFRWSVSDEYAGLFKSSHNFATEEQALADAERFVDRRTVVWQRRNKLARKPKRPRDLNQWAKRMVEIATGDADDREPTPEEEGKDRAAVERGRKGGAKGGKARAAALTPKERSESARKAVEHRWRR